MEPISSMIELDSSVTDRFRHPNQALNAGANSLHPVHTIITKGCHVDENRRLQGLGAVYGYHAPYRLFEECQLVAQQRRLPGTGLPSSMLSLELLLGIEDSIGLDEFAFLDRPADPTDRVGIHEAVEVRHTHSLN